MNNIEREETATRMKALDKEERTIALRCFPDEELLAELARRLKTSKADLKAVCQVARKYVN